MKTITKNIGLLFVLILGIIFSFSVNGQINKTFSQNAKIKPGSHLLKSNPVNSNFTLNQDAEQPVYKSTQKSYPQEVHHFYWDITTIWMASYNSYLTYDEYGNILSEIQTQATTGDTMIRFINTYDNEGIITERLFQYWNNGDWENSQRDIWTYDVHGNLEVYLFQLWSGTNWSPDAGEKHIYTYDSNDNITEEVIQYWNHGMMVWDNIRKYIKTYDANGYLIEYIDQYWDWQDVWVSDYKEIYTINQNGVITEALLQDWDNVNSIWVNMEKYVNVVWHNWTGDPEESEVESYTVLAWNSGIWENSWRTSITYDSYGGSVEIEEMYINNDWENAYKYTDSYDEHENYLGYQDEYWDNGVWKISWGSKYILTYDGNDLIRSIYQNWNGAEYVNAYKDEYSDFIDIEGLFENSLIPGNLSVYPNPTSGDFSILVDNPEMKNATIEIVNLSGQVVYNKQLLNADIPVQKIDLSNHSKGIYFVKLRSTNELRVGKLIVQ